ncbi:MAG: hypothetical protein HFF44_05280 [Lawsonibacter sp.]|nr:hypothetical protein [Lawsonibacter sp.]
MEEERILKKDGVRLVRKRLKELLKPLGFQSRSTNQLIRGREHFIDMVDLDTAGYHLTPHYHIYYRSAPFARLSGDMYRIWRAAKMNTPYWSCEIPLEGGPYSYKPEHFEAVWRDVSRALEQYLLPYMEAMTPERFLSLLVTDNRRDQDFFRPANLARLDSHYPGWPGTPEAAVYGVGMWRMEKFEEGIPYLILARKNYRTWMEDNEQEDSQFYRAHILTLELLDRLLTPWEKKRPGWTASAQRKIDQVELNWADYMR